MPLDALADGQVHEHTIAGPAAATLLAVERTVAGQRCRAAVARGGRGRSGGHARGRRRLRPCARAALLGLALPPVAAAVAQVAVGLAPFRTFARFAAGPARRAPQRARLEGRFPAEVQPLVDDFNAAAAARGSGRAVPARRPATWRM
ncbi:MAG: hypothetical protein U1F25_06275 [Rubrivivax sp.]